METTMLSDASATQRQVANLRLLFLLTAILCVKERRLLKRRPIRQPEFMLFENHPKLRRCYAKTYTLLKAQDLLFGLKVPYPVSSFVNGDFIRPYTLFLEALSDRLSHYLTAKVLAELDLPFPANGFSSYGACRRCFRQLMLYRVELHMAWVYQRKQVAVEANAQEELVLQLVNKRIATVDRMLLLFLPDEKIKLFGTDHLISMGR